VFDIGFTELMVIGVVALIVIGPERLPGVARTVGHLVGRLQRYVNDVKADISREMEFDELRKMRDSMQQAATEVETSVRGELSKTEQDLNKAVADAVEDKSIAPETAAMPEPPAAPEPPALPGASAASDVPAEPDKPAAPAKQA
jgi:sec-independent protein translocase protein TatB